LNATPSDELLRAASDWFARLHGGDATPQDHMEHEAWLSASPENRRSYEFVVESCALATQGAARRVAANDPILAHVADVPRAREPRRIKGRSLGWTLAASVATALVLGATYMERSGPKQYQTATGERRSITLEDGSVAVLNAASRITVRFRRDERRIELEQGEALFTVTKNPTRPFRVHAADRTVQAVGTKFEVDRHEAAVDVAVNEGIVAVSAPDTEPGVPTGAHAAARLRQGQAITYVSGGSIQDSRAIAPEQVGAWQSGLLIYEHAPFSWVVGDLGRQFKGNITVEDAQLASMPVSLTLKLHDRETTIRTLEKILPIRARYDGADTIRFVRANP
jgi:transmembrane sensor